METDTSLVRADSAIHLNAVTAVDVNLSLVVHPRNPEHNDALRLHHPLQDLHIHKMWIRHYIRGYAFYDFPDGLVEFLLTRVASDEFRHELLDIVFGKFVHCVIY